MAVKSQVKVTRPDSQHTAPLVITLHYDEALGAARIGRTKPGCDYRYDDILYPSYMDAQIAFYSSVGFYVALGWSAETLVKI